MDAETIAQELAEEIRRNTALRHRIGLDEGSDSGIVGDGEETTIGLLTTDGFPFFVKVEAA